MKDFVAYLISNIVDHPEDVSVEESSQEGGTVLLTVSVSQDDMGKVIGKEGRIIKAIRDLTHVLGIKKGLRPIINLTEK